MKSLLSSFHARTALMAAVLCVATNPSFAQPARADSPWSVTLGAGVRYSPDYMGSDKSSAQLSPILLASYRTGIGRFSFGDVPAAAGPFFAFTPYETSSLSLGIGVGRDAGREDEDASTFTTGSSSLRGMGDIDATPVFGAYGVYRLNRWRLAALFRQAIDRDEGHGGRLADLRLGYELEVPSPWNVDVGVGATFADSRYMNTMFGVTPQQSLASGFATYSAGSGLRDVSLNLGARYAIDAHVMLIGRASVSQLAGDAKDSPIVKSSTQASVFGGIAYRW